MYKKEDPVAIQYANIMMTSLH